MPMDQIDDKYNSLMHELKRKRDLVDKQMVKSLFIRQQPKKKSQVAKHLPSLVSTIKEKKRRDATAGSSMDRSNSKDSTDSIFESKLEQQVVEPESLWRRKAPPTED